MKWKTSSDPYECGMNLIAGKWKVGNVHYSGLVGKGDPKRYVAICTLPGFGTLGRYETEADAKAEVEKAVRKWFVEAGAVLGG
jgi:hypothetical protein